MNLVKNGERLFELISYFFVVSLFHSCRTYDARFCLLFDVALSVRQHRSLSNDTKIGMSKSEMNDMRTSDKTKLKDAENNNWIVPQFHSLMSVVMHSQRVHWNVRALKFHSNRDATRKSLWVKMKKVNEWNWNSFEWKLFGERERKRLRNLLFPLIWRWFGRSSWIWMILSMLFDSFAVSPLISLQHHSSQFIHKIKVKSQKLQKETKMNRFL